jgi:hypothetical protein
MAYTINDEYVENERVYYKGLVKKATLVAVNPTQKERAELGLSADKEPVYISKAKSKDISGNEVEVPSVKFDFFFKSPEVKGLIRMTIFLKDAPAIRPTGTVVAIDTYSNEHYFSSLTDFNGAKATGQNILWEEGGRVKLYKDFRIAREGEAEFRKFFKEYFQIPDPSYKDRETGVFKDKIDGDLAKCDTDLPEEQWKLLFKDYTQTNIFKDLQTQAKIGKRAVKLIYGIRRSGEKLFNEAITQVKSVRRNDFTDKEVANIQKGNKNTEFLDLVNNKLVLLPVHIVSNIAPTPAPSSNEEVERAVADDDDY